MNVSDFFEVDEDLLCAICHNVLEKPRSCQQGLPHFALIPACTLAICVGHADTYTGRLRPHVLSRLHFSLAADLEHLSSGSMQADFMYANQLPGEWSR